MDFGITIATAADSWQVVKRAEELGYTHAWFYDTQMLNADPFVAMAVAAVQTQKIHLGTGVLVPSNRLAPVTANCLASLNKLAPGRIHCGLGTGFTARRAMGLEAVKLDDMADYIRVVQGLLRQETLEWDYAGQRRAIRFLNPELELINLAETIPFYISAFGPRGKALTARLGVGWIYSVRNAEQAVAQLQLMQQAWRDAGRQPSTLYAVAQGSGCVLAEGEAYDSPARQSAGGSQRCHGVARPGGSRGASDVGIPVPRGLTATPGGVQDDLSPVYASGRQIPPGASLASHAPTARRGASGHRRHDPAPDA